MCSKTQNVFDFPKSVRFLTCSSGASVVEYSLMAALVSVVTLSALVALGLGQDDTYDCLSTSIEIGEKSILCNPEGRIG
ncbi:MAG: hypothetical protein AAGJ84_10180 [Pseudomonadota bacterium]